MKDIWDILTSIGFDPFVVLGGDDFDEIVKYGGEQIQDDSVYFYPDKLLDSAQVSEHIKSLLFEVFLFDPYSYQRVSAFRTKKTYR